MTSVVERLSYFATQTQDKVAIVFEGVEISYGELWDKTVRIAQLFRRQGLREDDRIVIQCKYDPNYVASIYATHLCGAAVVLVDKNATVDMIVDMMVQIDARLAVCNQRGERLEHGILYSELADNLPVDSSMEGLVFPDAESVAAIMFTTGTTGAPKGVQISQRNTTGWVMRSHEHESISGNSVVLTAVPLNHVAPLMRMNHSIYIGGTIVFMENLMKIARLFELMDRYGVTIMYLPPAGISMIQQLAKERLAKYANQLDYIVTGSSAMTSSQRDYLIKMLPHTRLFTCYGSSEAGMVTSYRFDNSERAINCCGKLFNGVELRIVDDAFQAVSTGQVGMIAIKSDMVMKGYYKRPELNGIVLRDGFFLSDDLGYLDEDGYLYVCGRKDDMINIGGLKVYPSEIENAALKIQGIVECICFGVPDPVTGQAVKLLIKTDDSFAGTVALVTETLSRTMDYYKVPKCIEIVDEIAKTANGKPDRKFYQQ